MIRYIIYNNARVIFRFFILSTSAHIRFETSFRLSRAPRGSRFLRKPAPCGRGGCAAPLAALGGRKEFGCGLMQGLCPCTPSGDTSPEPHALWRGITCRKEYEKNDKIYHI